MEFNANNRYLDVVNIWMQQTLVIDTFCRYDVAMLTWQHDGHMCT